MRRDSAIAALLSILTRRATGLDTAQIDQNNDLGKGLRPRVKGPGTHNQGDLVLPQARPMVGERYRRFSPNAAISAQTVSQLTKSVIAMRQPPMAGQQAQVFNNAVSFAQAFDEAWKKHEDSQPNHGLEQGEKMALILELVAEHPFRQNEPELSLQVATFRLRLLGL